MNPIWNGLLAVNARLSQLPASLIALLGRFSMAAVFWLSGQTKIEGLSINLLSGEFHLGWPHLSDTAIFLFQEEYALPLLAPTTAALLAALAEHLLPICLLFGFATRYAALGLLAMTLVIQVFVYPGAYATHGVWATVLLYLVANGAGKLSVDHGLLRLLRR
ncbi:DoxX family protein [Saccharospirillum mangrovi]|uniref:DoxX family protein n=1 Tax=Saccharospirillum mangrovi TaxID=2161747 RepID=UPI000D3A6CA7|nr:DoxX family protein [Saccharospirillum mangrovi]